ncbi:MAG: hypothetical protein QM702_04350 [Rubrivivax sp.]
MQSVIPTDSPAYAPFQSFMERLTDLASGQSTEVLLTCLMSLYRHVLLARPTFHASAAAHLTRLVAELQPSVDAGAVAAAGAPDEAAVVRLLQEVLQRWHVEHPIALGALMTLFRSLALQHQCCRDSAIEVTNRVLLELIGSDKADSAGSPTRH